MRRDHKLSPLDRGLAIALSFVCLSCGGVGLYVGLADARWGVTLFAQVAVVYGAAWLRVAARDRLLTWPELVAPGRSLKSGP